MSVPSATITELDGQLGIVPLSAGRIQCIVADANAGPLNTPAVFSKPTAIVTTFGGGPLVERACRALADEDGPGYVVLCRSDRATDGAASVVDDAGVTGTSVPVADVDPIAPWDAYGVKFEVILSGTIGTGPITLRYSLDAGLNYSKSVSLGTANTYTIPNSGVVVNFGAGTLVAGDSFTFTTTAPKWNAADLAVSLAAVQASTQPIESVWVGGACSGTEKDTIIAARAASIAAGKLRTFHCETRVPALTETDAVFQASIIADFAGHTDTGIEVVADCALVTSSVPGRIAVWQLRMPAALGVVPRYAAVEPHVDIAEKDLGPLDGVHIKDSNGNPYSHDEAESPGLDDAGFTTLRSWADKPSETYVNNPRIQSTAGSDFVFVQYRRVMNILRGSLKSYLESRLSKNVRVQTKGARRGRILESEAKEIEAGANRALWVASKEGRYISGDQTDTRFTLSRDDDILATSTLTYQARATPLGYIKDIDGDLGFSNPARAA
jgi:hypothetical protein